MLLQAVVGTLDAVFVGWLGAEALAGVSLVYPLLMLMQTMSAGGMGGGIASAVARALGGGRRADADRLAAHGILIALAMAALFTGTLLAAGPAVYAPWAATEPRWTPRSPTRACSSAAPSSSGSSTRWRA